MGIKYPGRYQTWSLLRETPIRLITEYLVNISKRRAFWSLNEDILKIKNDKGNQREFEILEDLNDEDVSLTCGTSFEVFNKELNRMSEMDDDLFTYEVEVANIPCDSNKDDDSENEADDDMGYDPSDVAFTEWLGLKNFNYKTMDHYTKKALWIYWIRGDDKVELKDEEFSDNEDYVTEVFRIDTNIFNFETPIYLGGVERDNGENIMKTKYKKDISDWNGLRCYKGELRDQFNKVKAKDIYSLINHYTDAKDIWKNVKMILEGSKLTKDDRESQLYDEFEHFRHIKETEEALLILVKRNPSSATTVTELGHQARRMSRPKRLQKNSELLQGQDATNASPGEWSSTDEEQSLFLLPITADECDAFDSEVDEFHHTDHDPLTNHHIGRF
ncbi:hypothetical protein Tco_0007972 [Tanacetum coccineum]